MKLFRVVGNVTLSRCHPGYQSTTLLATEPAGEALVRGRPTDEPDLLVVWDELGAGHGSLLAVSDGAEAAQPFRPEMKAVDAYCSAILDDIHIDAAALNQLESS